MEQGVGGDFMIRERWTVGVPLSPLSPLDVGRRRLEEGEGEEGDNNTSNRIVYYCHCRYPIASTTFIIYIHIFVPRRRPMECTVS